MSINIKTLFGPNEPQRRLAPFPAADSKAQEQFRRLAAGAGLSDEKLASKKLFDKRNKKSRYKIDLLGQMVEAETNYVRLLKILPNFKNAGEWSFSLGKGAAHIDVKIKVVDRAPYTTTLQLAQISEKNDCRKAEPRSEFENPLSSSVKTPTLTICLYHDAGMAEVVAWENHRRLRPRYKYPNSNMYQVDEKAQCNRYLSEWLILCQEQGRSAVNMQDLGLPTAASKVRNKF